ncbi:MAG: hypothetical protein U0457_02945 [Candidatus Sericytochromatia bacterium]
MKKIILLAILLIPISCGGGGSGSTTSIFIPSSTPSSSPASSNTLTNNVPAEKKYEQPITKETFADPKIQAQSYQKILKALETNDFEYIFKEYDAGGLKISAIRAETEFNDYPLNYTINSVAQNIGQIGMNKTNLYDYTLVDRKVILKNALRNLMIQSVRGQARRLVENNIKDLTDDNKFGEDIAKNTAIFFYGSDNNTVLEGSPASFVKTVEVNNKIKAYDNIVSSLNVLNSEAKKGDLSKLILSRDLIETNLVKTLYISLLDKVATAISKKDNSFILDAEYFYLSIKNFIKSSDNTNTFQVEKLFFSKDYNSVKYTDFERALASGLKEKALIEMENAIKNMENKNFEAVTSATLAKLYLDIINESYDNPRFTKTGDPEMTKASDSFINAIKLKDKNLANTSKDKLFKIFLK